ncbi:hypothetical protein K474DRAFT_1705526 [Panus rudis PR-1116 ss-1]|nr:hypothetical protein K474DRAFT_1705526 [Panus rudis PR-1116 ss-1]
MRPQTRSARHVPSIQYALVGTSHTTSGPKSSQGGEPASTEIVKKSRHRMTNVQLQQLEALYQKSTHPSREEKQALGNGHGMTARTVTVWFQNRRQLAKKAQVEAATSERQSAATRPPLVTVSGHVNTQRPAKPQTILPRIGKDITCSFSSISPMEHIQCSTNPFREHDDGELIHGPTPATKTQLKRTRSANNCSGGVNKRLCFEDTGSDQSSCGNATDEESEIVSMSVGGYHPATALALAAKLESRRRYHEVTIPAEYSAAFPADIILGASLLLTFQHSAY